MVQTPGSVRSKDTVLGGEVKSFELNISVVKAQLGTIPVFVVPAGENYRVTGMRVVCTLVATGSTSQTIKITGTGAGNITAATTIAGAAIGDVVLPTILTTANIDDLAYGDTLSIVTADAGTATAGEYYVRIDLVRTTGNM